MITKIQKSILYSRIRQYLPMVTDGFTNDRSIIDNAGVVTINWPSDIKKPNIGIVQDFGQYPRWTKHVRFLENNSIPYKIYPINNNNWLELAEGFDVIVGVISNASYDLTEIRRKYYILETILNKSCYPSMHHVFLYEDKELEADISKIFKIPFVKTYISHNKIDALRLIESFTYPMVSKISPSSSSLGVELVRTKKQARKIVERAFSQNGRKIHVVYSRQKNYVYFQDYIPNDGYDIRVITVGNRVFGYYRKVPKGDFRASGMLQEEMRSLPEETMRIARKVNSVIKSPQLIVDMLYGDDGLFHINEFSPIVQMSTLDQLRVNDIPGAYVFDNDDSFHFEAENYWVQELALKEYFLNFYLPGLMNRS